jgi:hypothetical protein
MKKLILTIVTIFAIHIAKAQLSSYPTICFIEYKYDNAGNRVSRMFECGENPFYGSDKDEDNGGGHGGGTAKMINTKTTTERTVIFPNPTNGMFYVKLPYKIEECMVEIRDIQGKLLKQQHLTNMSIGIDISSYANGQYFINVITGNNKELLKLLKTDNE